MGEFIYIFRGIIYAILSLIIFAIIIPLSYYLHKKRTTVNSYRHIEFTVIFGLLLWAFWDSIKNMPSNFKIMIWSLIFILFSFLHLILWANPVNKNYEKKRGKK